MQYGVITRVEMRQGWREMMQQRQEGKDGGIATSDSHLPLTEVYCDLGYAHEVGEKCSGEGNVRCDLGYRHEVE